MKQGIEAAESAVPDIEANWVAFLFFSARFVIATILTLALLPKARAGFSNPDSVRGGLARADPISGIPQSEHWNHHRNSWCFCFPN